MRTPVQLNKGSFHTLSNHPEILHSLLLAGPSFSDRCVTRNRYRVESRLDLNLNKIPEIIPWFMDTAQSHEKQHTKIREYFQNDIINSFKACPRQPLTQLGVCKYARHPSSISSTQAVKPWLPTKPHSCCAYLSRHGTIDHSIHKPNNLEILLLFIFHLIFREVSRNNFKANQTKSVVFRKIIIKRKPICAW